MPRYNVKNFQNEWACFSSITDSFITPFMPLSEYEKWRKKQYGNDYCPLEEANRMDIDEAIFSLSLNHNDKEIIENLTFAKIIIPLNERGDSAQNED